MLRLQPNRKAVPEKRWLFLRRDFPGSEKELRWLGLSPDVYVVPGCALPARRICWSQ
jgi:hypothetical protein